MAIGEGATASGPASIAVGYYVDATNYGSNAFGVSAYANGYTAHAVGNDVYAYGDYTQAMGRGIISHGRATHIFGEYNVDNHASVAGNNRGTYVEIVGNGTGGSARSNARTLDWNGNQWVAGNLTAAGGSITIGSTTLTEAQLQSLLSNANLL